MNVHHILFIMLLSFDALLLACAPPNAQQNQTKTSKKHRRGASLFDDTFQPSELQQLTHDAKTAAKIYEHQYLQRKKEAHSEQTQPGNKHLQSAGQRPAAPPIPPRPKWSSASASSSSSSAASAACPQPGEYEDEQIEGESCVKRLVQRQELALEVIAQKEAHADFLRSRYPENEEETANDLYYDEDEPGRVALPPAAAPPMPASNQAHNGTGNPSALVKSVLSLATKAANFHPTVALYNWWWSGKR